MGPSECTLDILKELEEHSQNCTLQLLTIEVSDTDNKYYATYNVSDESIEISLSRKLYIKSILSDFAAMLVVDKINNFSLYYVPATDICVISKSYKISIDEITTQTKIDKVKDDLVKALLLLDNIGVADHLLTGVYSKSNKQNLNQEVLNQKQNKNKVRYQEITIDDVINKILQVLD